ncbi:MAG TPA: bifunctional hydroxymethylpyrimidine kinase/phosphomethylpyrimidine kinase [Acidimicrobiales bacterium]|nr:bifunctional hydroxymethylpyrimidine kinase/phosphomethylpyrimidine kinase [Acidimicrobiales bacterium]
MTTATGPRVALTIAGSDSGGGAGIQADLKAFAANGVFGTTAVTAVTAQNTRAVEGVVALDADFVEAQISAVVSDLRVAAVKTGMLASAATVAMVARRAAAGDLPNLVVDPVMVASTGRRLVDEEAARVYLEELVPRAVLVTPTLGEAGLLVGRPVETVDDMRVAADQLWRRGARYVLVKGGHLGGPAVDVLFDGRDHVELSAPRVETANVHGTGCTLSATAAAQLALGRDVPEAVAAAKRYVTSAIEGAAHWRLGAGHGPLDHFGWSADQL